MYVNVITADRTHTKPLTATNDFISLALATAFVIEYQWAVYALGRLDISEMAYYFRRLPLWQVANFLRRLAIAFIFH